MIKPIETEHRGYRISFNENTDEWSCSDIGASSPSLHALRAKVDKFCLQARKAAAMPAYYISASCGRSPRLIAVQITGYVIDQASLYPDSANAGDPRVAIVGAFETKDRVTRRVERLSSLVPDAPEALEAFYRFRDAYEALIRANRAQEAARKAIPQFETESVKALLALAEREEGAS